jgi:hypothetical protein
MNHATQCQFCKRHLVLQVDPDYIGLGDYLKLIPLAACDRCADLREKRRSLEEKIRRICIRLTQLTGPPRYKAAEQSKEPLRVLTQAYSRMIADWLNASHPAWDSECVELMVDRPDQYGRILSQLWKLYQDKPKQEEVGA